MERRKVEVGRDHVQKLIGTSPMRAVHELIWNGLDAGGNRVDVQVRCNALGAADRLEVIDHGPGIARAELEVAFGKIGDSSKAKRPTNTEGRAFHGREGKGRFRSLAICPKVLWKTTYRTPGGDLQTYSVTLSRDDPEFFEATDPEPATGQPTGTRVILDGVDRGHVTLSATTANELAEEYAAYLKSYPNVELHWNGQKVTLAPLIRREATIKVPLPDGDGATLDLDIIEWNFKPSAKRLHICDESGFSFHETAAGVHAPGIDYTAYLKTPKARA